MASCAAVEHLIKGAPAGAQLVVAVAPEFSWFEPLYSDDRTFAWGRDPAQAGAVLPNAPGHASSDSQSRADARYAVWVQGDFPRPLVVHVDGRVVGSVSGSNTPGQWLQAARCSSRLGATWSASRAPRGTGISGRANGASGRSARSGSSARSQSACARLRSPTGVRCAGERVDWIEVVRP